MKKKRSGWSVSTDEEIQDQYYDNARTAGSMRGLLVNGELTDVKYSYSKCCNPIPGDDVIGFPEQKR